MEPDTNLNAGNGMGTGGTSPNAGSDTSTFFNVDGKAETSTPVVQAVPEKAPEEVKPKAISLEPIASVAPESVMAEKETAPEPALVKKEAVLETATAPKPAVEATSFTNLQKSTVQPQAEVQVKTPAQLSSAFAATDLSLTELTSPPETQPMSRLKIALIVGGVLLVLGGVAAAIFLRSSSNLKGDITAAPQTCATDTYAPKAGTSATTATGNNFGADLTALRAPAISQPNYTNVYYPAPAPISNQGAAAVANNSPGIANNPAVNQVSNAGAPVVNNNPAAAVSNKIPSLREAPAANSGVLNNAAPVGNNAVGGTPAATIGGSPAMTVGGTPAATVVKTPVLSVGGTPPSSAAVGSPITVGGSTSSATTANPTSTTIGGSTSSATTANPTATTTGGSTTTTGGSSTSTTTPNAPVCSPIEKSNCALVSELYTNQDKYILNAQTISDLKTWNDVCTARTSSTTPNTTPTTGGTTTTSSTTTTTSSTTPNTNLTTGGGTTSTTVGVTPPTTTTGGSTTATGGSTLTTGGTVSTSTSNTRTTTTTTGSTLPTASTGLITTTTGSTTTTTGGTGLTTTPAPLNSCQQQDKDIQDAYRNQQWQTVLDLTNVKIDSTICRIASGTDRTKEKLLFALISSTSQKMTSLRPALSREIADLRTTLVRDGNIIPPTSSTVCTDSQRNPQPITTSLETVLGNPDQVTTSSGSSATTGSLPNIDLTTVSDGQLMGGFAICSQTTKTAISPATTEAPKQTDAPPATQPTTDSKKLVDYIGSGSLQKQSPPTDQNPVAPLDQNLDLGLGSGSGGSVSAPVPPAGSEAPAAPVAPVSPLQSESIATTGFTSSASAPVPSNVINPPKLATVTPTNTIVPASTTTPKTTTPALHGAAPTGKPVPPELTKTGPEDFYYLLMMLPIALFFKWKLGKAK